MYTFLIRQFNSRSSHRRHVSNSSFKNNISRIICRRAWRVLEPGFICLAQRFCCLLPSDRNVKKISDSCHVGMLRLTKNICIFTSRVTVHYFGTNSVARVALPSELCASTTFMIRQSKAARCSQIVQLRHHIS